MIQKMMGFITGLALIVSLMLGLCAPAHADERFASYVIELNSGRVLNSKNADSPRYPASLTKTMTMYLTFEAVKNGKLRWDTPLSVSAKAAGQPQTNIGLREGNTITVKEAVESLIVRSANDAAVVLAEAVGGTEWNFALKMTQKARALGMKNTTFKNANGLHHPQQVTTAKDMARIAIALERDFPDYFPLFKTIDFRYKGKTYETHNRVMRYYRGATGLKTGFVRASGFNLITTASRNGHDIVAVIMGGVSSKSRDNQMISMLDKSFAQLDGRKPSKEMAFADTDEDEDDDKPDLRNNAPLLPKVSEDADDAPKPLNRFMKVFVGNIPTPVAGKGAPAQAPQVAMSAAAPAAGTLAVKPTIAAGIAPAPVPQASPAAVAAQQAAAQLTQPGVTPTARWGIQVGTFSDPSDAAAAVAHASALAKPALKGAAVAITNVGEGQSRLHRARLAGLSQDQARSACQMLLAAQESCFVYQQN